MKITFIRPNMMPVRGADAMEPLVFAILAGLTPPHVETVLYDDRIEPIPVDEPTDLVAITVETYTARRAYEIADVYRRRGVPVVMGGYHATFLPEEVLDHADAVVVGDAEGIWPQVVRDAERGRLQRIYRQDGYPELAGYMPDRSIFRGKRYAPAALVQYGRGCRFACEFCSIHAFYGKNLRQRPVDEVVEEIRATGKKHIFLIDDNIFVDVPRAKELFEALIPLKIRWSCQVSIDVTRDAELMDLLRRSGCTTAVVGFESLNEDNLRHMKKHWNVKHQDYATSVRILQDHGVMIYGSFVFGYDGDSVESFQRTLDFTVQNKFYTANFNPLTPMPGAALYDRLATEERLLYERWWLDPRFRYGEAVFRPRGMTPNELTAGCHRIRKAFHSTGAILHRAAELRTNARDPYRLGLHLASNFVSKWMIDKKQGRPLGTEGDRRLTTVELPRLA
ncbi:radical SAM protein [bacterium]|nr:radical SAM protein [bacterium]